MEQELINQNEEEMAKNVNGTWQEAIHLLTLILRGRRSNSLVFEHHQPHHKQTNQKRSKHTQSGSK